MNLQNLTTIPFHIFCFNLAIHIFRELIKIHPAVFLPQGSPKSNSIISWKHKIKPLTCFSFMIHRTQIKVRYQFILLFHLYWGLSLLPVVWWHFRVCQTKIWNGAKADKNYVLKHSRNSNSTKLLSFFVYIICT